jgi:hypothetical protein
MKTPTEILLATYTHEEIVAMAVEVKEMESRLSGATGNYKDFIWVCSDYFGSHLGLQLAEASVRGYALSWFLGKHGEANFPVTREKE